MLLQLASSGRIRLETPAELFHWRPLRPYPWIRSDPAYQYTAWETGLWFLKYR